VNGRIQPPRSLFAVYCFLISDLTGGLHTLTRPAPLATSLPLLARTIPVTTTVLPAHLAATAMDLSNPVCESLTHDKEPGTLYGIEVLRLFLDLVARQLCLCQSQLDHGVRKFGNAVLIGSDARLKLSRQRLPQSVPSRAQLTSSAAELLAGGSELRGLIVGQAQLLLRSRGKALLDPVSQ
jgi:hypothetical protein